MATGEAQAIALVDRAKANGFTGVKFYGTFNPDGCRGIKEAHKLALHVLGIPRVFEPWKRSTTAMTSHSHHWIIMQAMPDSVIAESMASCD